MPKWKTMGNKSGQSDVLYGKGWHSHWNGPARCVYKYVWDMHWAWEGFVSIFSFSCIHWMIYHGMRYGHYYPALF